MIDTEKRNTISELEDCLIRQAESMGLSPGSYEFERMVINRIVNPEVNLMHAVRGSKYRSIRSETFMDSIDNKWRNLIHIKKTMKWAKLNKGMNLNRAADILGTTPAVLINLGQEASGLGMENHVPGLDGSDDRTDCSPVPGFMGSGHRGTVGTFEP
jgi:hypothetical protein